MAFTGITAEIRHKWVPDWIKERSLRRRGGEIRGRGCGKSATPLRCWFRWMRSWHSGGIRGAKAATERGEAGRGGQRWRRRREQVRKDESFQCPNQWRAEDQSRDHPLQKEQWRGPRRCPKQRARGGREPCGRAAQGDTLWLALERRRSEAGGAETQQFHLRPDRGLLSQPGHGALVRPQQQRKWLIRLLCAAQFTAGSRKVRLLSSSGHAPPHERATAVLHESARARVCVCVSEDEGSTLVPHLDTCPWTHHTSFQ